MRFWQILVLAFLTAATLHFHREELASMLHNAEERLANPPAGDYRVNPYDIVIPQ